MDRVVVTDHALARWRQRVAVYGDEKADAVVSALRAATPLRHGEPLPKGMAWVGGFRYFRHAGRASVYFVTEPLGLGAERVITVVDTAAPVPPPKLPGRLRKAAPEEPDDGAPPDMPATFPDIGAERAWLVAMVMEADGELGRLGKLDRDRPVWAERRAWLADRLVAIRDEWRGWKAARQRELEVEIRRPDGGLNYGPAIEHLLAEVERLTREVAEFRAAAGVPGSAC